MVKECPLLDLAAKVAVVRDCATTFRAVSYDKGLFDQFEGLLSKLELWGGLERGYEEKKSILLSDQTHLKKEDAMYAAEIEALEEEKARLDTKIHKLKTQQEHKRSEVQSQS
ncbi:hypothetical protein AMTR_s00152p00086970 [Amborella trichopoda]|uniref:Uncharacterized protein n=1 Tax=Amborella trichopoda TaxID=13333 RepID=W1PLF5_AMBTC|nr:hypothetical protein AMTR_s00152p00086970 [Amborella trichopoda]